MKQLLILIAAVAFSVSAFAQEKSKSTKKSRKEEKRAKINALIKAEEEGVIAYKKHYAFGIKLNTDGYGFSFEKAYAKSVKRATIYQLEITERKHKKEEKQSNLAIPASPIIYGKINFFYPIKLGVQKQFLFANKSNKNGVSITGNIGGGFIVGLLRAYEIEVDDFGGRRYIRYDSPDSLIFADPSGRLPAGPNLGRGWNHMKVTPGLYAKPGLRFDYGRYNDLVAAIEVGVIAEYYTKKIPQMISNDEKQFFFSAYFTLMFGKRK